MVALTLANLTNAYVGRDRVCRCGCAGTYHDVGSRGAKMAYNRVMKQHTMFPFDVSEPFGGEVHLDYAYGNDRATTVYFFEGGKEAQEYWERKLRIRREADRLDASLAAPTDLYSYAEERT